MKPSVMFIGYDPLLEDEIREFMEGMAGEVHFAGNTETSIRILDERCIHKVVLNMQSLRDAVVLRYISRYHRSVEVVISANPELDEVISIFHANKYRRLPRPFRLEELKAVL